MRLLWTFETQEKYETFANLLRENDIEFETAGKGAAKGAGGISMSVDERDYEKARRILMRHRKRRTSADFH